MAPLTSLRDEIEGAVLDTSAIINLSRSGIAASILSTVPHRFVVSEAVEFELKSATRTKDDQTTLAKLISEGLIAVAPLDDSSSATFEALTIGSAAETLDDGEAATIAIAQEQNFIAVIDERKGNSLSARKFPKLVRATSLDIFGHHSALAELGEEVVGDAVFNALFGARMNVLPDQLPWVVELIGKERAERCPSLSKAALAKIIRKA